MIFKLLSLGSMYPGSLDTFYLKYPDLNDLTYKEHIDFLLENTTEFIGSYNRNFNRAGLFAECIIANDTRLQNKWCIEKGIKTEDYQSIILSQVKSFSPDILWIEDLNYSDPGWLSDVKREVKSIRLIIAYHCSPFNKKVLDNLKGVDFLITCTPGLKTEIENLGKKSFLVYHAFDKDLLSKISEKNEFTDDFIFSGSLISGGNFHSKRIALIESIIKADIGIGLYVNLEKNYRIRAKQLIYFLSSFLRNLKMDNLVERHKFFDYGKTWVDTYSGNLLKLKKKPVYGIDMYNLFNLSKVVLNYHIGVAGDYAGNMRMFEVTGIGSCLLTDNKKNIKDLFDPGSEIVVYDNAEDCAAKVKWLLEHESERQEIALAGQKRTLAVHTVENRCISIIDIINSELQNLSK